jgi:hypothetical protein
MTIRFIYTGRGDALIHVPPRDLTDEDFAEREELWKENGITEAVLLGSGLYKKPTVEQPKRNKAAKEGE